MSELLTDVIDRLSRIEDAIQPLVRDRTPKAWYSTGEVAAILRKAEYTVREWCRHRRVRAIKNPYSRGAHPEWLVGHEELTRVRNEGLLLVAEGRDTP